MHVFNFKLYELVVVEANFNILIFLFIKCFVFFTKSKHGQINARTNGTGVMIQKKVNLVIRSDSLTEMLNQNVTL